jgi:hypothetical protein
MESTAFVWEFYYAIMDMRTYYEPTVKKHDLLILPSSNENVHEFHQRAESVHVWPCQLGHWTVKQS